MIALRCLLRRHSSAFRHAFAAARRHAFHAEMCCRYYAIDIFAFTPFAADIFASLAMAIDC